MNKLATIALIGSLGVTGCAEKEPYPIIIDENGTKVMHIGTGTITGGGGAEIQTECCDQKIVTSIQKVTSYERKPERHTYDIECERF